MKALPSYSTRRRSHARWERVSEFIQQQFSRACRLHIILLTQSIPAFKTVRIGMVACMAARCPGLGRRRSIALLLMLLMPSMAASQGEAKNPHEVEAAFLRNFAHYVTWPYHAFSDDSSPWHIGILGEDPFGAILEATFEGRAENGRSFAVFRAATLDELPPCQIIFIAYENAGKRRLALDALKHKPVLTVGDAPEFLGEGGVIQFQVGDRVHMNINLDQARAAALTIQTKMLEVASDILEGGEFRRMR